MAEKKKGGISIKQGRILMSTDDGEVDLDLSYVKKDIRKAIHVTARSSFYSQLAHSFISELNYSGLRAIPPILKKVENLTGIPFKGISFGGISFGGGNKVKPSHRERVFDSRNADFLQAVHSINIKKGAKHKSKSSHIGLTTEANAKRCFVQWAEWLNMIRSFGASKKKPRENPNKAFEDSFDKCFSDLDRAFFA